MRCGFWLEEGDEVGQGVVQYAQSNFHVESIYDNGVLLTLELKLN